MGFELDLLKEIKEKNEANLKFTGEKELYLSKNDFIEKMLQNEKGNIYLHILEKENMILERQGLIEGNKTPAGIIYFFIYDYDMLLTALHSFYITCYKGDSTNG